MNFLLKKRLPTKAVQILSLFQSVNANNQCAFEIFYEFFVLKMIRRLHLVSFGIKTTHRLLPSESLQENSNSKGHLNSLSQVFRSTRIFNRIDF